jgi:hypothetical protein
MPSLLPYGFGTHFIRKTASMCGELAFFRVGEGIGPAIEPSQLLITSLAWISTDNYSPKFGGV